MWSAAALLALFAGASLPREMPPRQLRESCRRPAAARSANLLLPFLTLLNPPCYCEELFWPQSTHWVPELLWRERLSLMGLTKLVIRGARQHNLKNISLEIPLNTHTVITGLSGSGKSSLAFDTIYAEGQRRYVESLSAYARQFLDQMERPEVDVIEGLSPSIAIEQKTTTRS